MEMHPESTPDEQTSQVTAEDLRHLCRTPHGGANSEDWIGSALDVLMEAADALEAREAEVARLTAELEEAKAMSLSKGITGFCNDCAGVSRDLVVHQFASYRAVICRPCQAALAAAESEEVRDV